MEILTSRFGKIDIEEDKIITFKREILGFPRAKRFVLLPHRESSPFYWLQCLDQPDLAFVVVNPGIFVMDYSFDLPDDIQEELLIKGTGDVAILVIVTIERGKEASRITANLLGPIVINARLRLAGQVVLNPNRYPVDFPLSARIGKGEEKSDIQEVLQAGGPPSR